MSALIQQTAEWHEMRRSKIGASDAAIIMEESPWKTPFQLWCQKVQSGSIPEKSIALLRGIELEPIARQRFMDMTGICVSPDVIINPNNNWMMASLDGIDEEKKNIVEIKCPGKEDHSSASEGIIPRKYYPQLQHQLEVCALDMAYYFSFDGIEGVIIKIYRDDKYIKNMISKEKEFWDRIQDFRPPMLIERDYVYKDNEIWNNTASEWKNLNRQIIQLESRRDELKDILVSQCAQRNSRGGGLKVSKVLRKGAIGYGEIPELIGIDLESYRKKPIEYWKIGTE